MDYTLLADAVNILMTEDANSYGKEYYDISAILENADSPITRKNKEILFQSVIDKGHIDFGDIPKSAGNIKNYSGYQNMKEIIDVITKLAIEQKSNDVLKYVKILSEAVTNLEGLSEVYHKGFTSKNDYVMSEYNTYLFTCVEATSTLIYEYVEYIKNPETQTLKMQLKNTKLRANELYFTQLQKFNNVMTKMGSEYKKMIMTLCNNGKNNFVGLDTGMVVGAAAISLVALSIVPITRSLIYYFYKFRVDMSKELEMQANFLEMNKSCLESNTLMTADKRKKILAKQEKLKAKLLRLADVLKVKSAKAHQESKKDLDKDNKMLSIDSIRDNISDSPLELV